MTRRYRTAAAALTVAAALTSCSLHLDRPPTIPAPSTRIAAPLAIITAPSTTPKVQTPATALPTTTPATAEQNLADSGAPANQVVLSNPKFSLEAIDLSSAEQVAWAYLTERLSYSYLDTQPGAGVARAARYLTPDAATQTPPPATGDPAQDDQWAAVVTARTVASTTVTTFHPDTAGAGAEALVVADWNRVLSNNTGTPLRTTGTTTVTLHSQSDNSWRITDSGMGTAG